MQWTISYYGPRLRVAAEVSRDRQLPPALKTVIAAMLAAPAGVGNATDKVQVYTSGSASLRLGGDAWVFKDLRLTLTCGDQSKARDSVKAWAR
jgi:hypothetical protein